MFRRQNGRSSFIQPTGSTLLAYRQAVNVVFTTLAYVRRDTY